MTKKSLLAVSMCVAWAYGCSSEASESADDLRAGERKIVGPAQPYPADLSLASKVTELSKSQKLRREAAWKAFARALAPIKVRETSLKGETGNTLTLPLFRTWYGRDDIDRVFDKAYQGLSPSDRVAQKPLSDDELAQAYDWNVREATSWKDADYLARVKAAADSSTAQQGIAGNSKVTYSPGFVSHLLSNYGPVTKCIDTAAQFGIDARPQDPKNFAPCFPSEFPADAAVVKASWWRSNFGMGLPVRPTDAVTLKKRMAGELDKGAWSPGDDSEQTVTPDEKQIYSVKMNDEATFRLAGIHLITKETRDWLWISLFWSNDPDSDFGQDRPEEIKALGEPWNHYKMCVVTAFEEQDPDPRGGFTGSLGDALAAVHGRESWCSNPYIERGAKNAQTNCIGCHQHSGDGSLDSEKILADGVKFPQAGRSKLREVFASDYSWSLFGRPESLAQAMRARMP